MLYREPNYTSYINNVATIFTYVERLNGCNYKCKMYIVNDVKQNQ